MIVFLYYITKTDKELTYKIFSNCNSVRKSGTNPLKLLFDKSLQGTIQMRDYNSESTSGEK